MRKLALALGVTLLAGTAQANTINFGTPVYTGSGGVVSGNAADISASRNATINNGANDNTASAAVVGQASADQGPTTNPTAIADITITYQIPYTVTRDWTSTTGPIPQLVIPTQQITLNLNYSGEVAKDNSQTLGGLGQALATAASVTSVRFGAVTMGSTRSQTGGGGLARTPFNDTIPDITGTAGRTFDGSAGEIVAVINLPTNYRDFTDLDGSVFAYPNGWNSTVHSGTQSFTDTLTVSFRLRAESRASGSVSTTGGEALACAGQVSPLGSFVLDNAAACGTGLTIAATVTQTGTTSALVPEPTTLVLIGSGLAGLVAFGARRTN